MGTAPDAGIYIMRSGGKIANRGFFLSANMREFAAKSRIGLGVFELEKEWDAGVR
jgi:hypothetical protein